MFPKIMQASSLVIGRPRWDELEDESDEVESVRDENPDDLRGVHWAWQLERGRFT